MSDIKVLNPKLLYSNYAQWKKCFQLLLQNLVATCDVVFEHSRYTTGCYTSFERNKESFNHVKIISNPNMSENLRIETISLNDALFLLLLFLYRKTLT